MVIESFSNPKYKYLLSLSKSRTRKKDGVFLMEGKIENELALQSGHHAQMLVFSDSYISQREIDALAKDKSTQIIQLSKALFDSLSYQHVPNNYICVYPSFNYTLESMSIEGPCVVMEKVEKPGNLGAILRTCDALGIKNIIATESPVDLFNPNILRNSRGALFTMRCVFTTNVEALQFLKEKGFKVYAASLSDDARDYREIPIEVNNAYVFGSEAYGLSEFWMKQSDENIIIPMKGAVDSLNVSVSAAIILSHHINQSLNP